MLPDFALPPWEAGILAEGEPACVPATRRVEVGSRWGKTAYLVREATNKSRRVKTLVQRDEPDAATLVLRDFTEPSNALKLLKEISDRDIVQAITNKEWTRFIEFDSHLKLLKPGDATTRKFSVTGNNRTWWYGEWDLPCEFSLDGRPDEKGWGETLSAARIEVLVNNASRKKNSDCRFGLRWASHSLPEKLRWLYDVERGSFDECEAVLRWFVTLGTWWDGASSATLLGDASDDDQPVRRHPRPLAESRLLVLRATQSYAELEEPWITFSPSQRQLLSVFDRYFGLRYNKECLRHQSLGFHRFASWLIQVDDAPTHHERLEARLHLRDWLQDKVAPEKIPFLLGEQ